MGVKILETEGMEELRFAEKLLLVSGVDLDSDPLGELDGEYEVEDNSEATNFLIE